MAKKSTPAENMERHAEEIKNKIDQWKYLKEYGGQDPFWPDGCNMNLLRNHIIYAKLKIRELKEEYGLPLPEEYFIPTPPEVKGNYMANLDQKERVKRLRQHGERLTTQKMEYDQNQRSMF